MNNTPSYGKHACKMEETAGSPVAQSKGHVFELDIRTIFFLHLHSFYIISEFTSPQARTRCTTFFQTYTISTNEWDYTTAPPSYCVGRLFDACVGLFPHTTHICSFLLWRSNVVHYKFPIKELTHYSMPSLLFLLASLFSILV